MATSTQLPDAALSFLASDLPDNSTAKAMAAILLIAVIAAALLHYLSPMRLARILVAAIVATEKTYLEALETGLLSASDVHTAEMLSTWVDPRSPRRLIYLRCG
jgi:predicted GNAT superfamily acetyltransferase